MSHATTLFLSILEKTSRWPKIPSCYFPRARLKCCFSDHKRYQLCSKVLTASAPSPAFLACTLPRNSSNFTSLRCRTDFLKKNLFTTMGYNNVYISFKLYCMSAFYCYSLKVRKPTSRSSCEMKHAVSRKNRGYLKKMHSVSSVQHLIRHSRMERQRI